MSRTLAGKTPTLERVRLQLLNRIVGCLLGRTTADVEVLVELLLQGYQDMGWLEVSGDGVWRITPAGHAVELLLQGALVRGQPPEAAPGGPASP